MDIYQHQARKKSKAQLRKLRKRRAREMRAAAARRSIPAFYSTPEWRELRYLVLKRDGGRCQLCGRSAADGSVMNVDHIKPRHKYPHLAMDESNLQVLCATCNAGKGGRDETDWREGISIEKALDIVYLVDLRERGLLH